MKRATALLLAALLLFATGAARASEYEMWTNILMLGADEASGDPEGTQTIVVMSVNTTDKEVCLTSVMQDIEVQTESFGKRPLRELYALGGTQALMDALNALLDIEMRRYILIDMTPLSDIVDMLGGVTIDPEDTLYEILKPTLEEASLPCPADDGPNLYMGAQALIYSRLREIGTTYALNHSQRDVIIAASLKVLGSGVFSCLRIVPKLFEMLTMNLSFGELIGMIYGLTGMNAYAIPEMWVPAEVESTEKAKTGWLLRVDGQKCRERFHSFVYGEESRYIAQ